MNEEEMDKQGPACPFVNPSLWRRQEPSGMRSRKLPRTVREMLGKRAAHNLFVALTNNLLQRLQRLWCKHDLAWIFEVSWYPPTNWHFCPSSGPIGRALCSAAFNCFRRNSEKQGHNSEITPLQVPITSGKVWDDFDTQVATFHLWPFTFSRSKL